MTIIVDRRGQKSAKNEGNRKRFIDRYKKSIKHTINRAIHDRSMKDAEKPIDVPINHSINEDKIDYDRETGDYEHVIAGNKEFIKGDKIDKDYNAASSGSGDGDEGEDEFTFLLTKEEFYDLFFEDMELPDFIKESVVENNKMVIKRAGYVKEGIPARLDIKKSMEMAIMRRLANRNSSSGGPFIDEIDLRYRHFKLTPQPLRQAVIFLLMDVSGSMGVTHKLIAKKFFLFLYLFLKKQYERVELRFIRYHHNAADVTEEEFFYSRETGGTNVTRALELVNEIIDNDYPSELWNIYIAHVSDGDFGWNENIPDLIELLLCITSKSQYYAYLQVQDTSDVRMFEGGAEKLYGELRKVKNSNEKVNIATAAHPSQIYQVLRKLFKRRGS